MPLNLKYLRKRKKMTQSAVAERLGIEISNYNRLERGKTELTYTRMVQLAAILGCDPVDFISENLATSPALRHVTVKGYVQAGHWAETTEWQADDFYDVAIPADQEFDRPQPACRRNTRPQHEPAVRRRHRTGLSG